MEIEDLATLTALLDEGRSLHGVRVQGIDLDLCADRLLARSDLHGLVVLDGAGTDQVTHERRSHGAAEDYEPLAPAVADLPRARCLVLAGPRVEAFLVEHPRVMYRMLQAMARRIKAANRWTG